MKIPKREIVESLRRRYVGKRVKLIDMDDPQAPPKGTMGKCWGVDDMGNLLMEWDNGSGLNLLPEKDSFQVMEGEA